MPDGVGGNSYDPDWEPNDDPFTDEDEFGDPTDDDLDEISDEEEAEFGEQMEMLLSQYQAETDEFNNEEAEFTEKYGFVHKCRCAADWEEGNLGVVSVCYLGMVTDAMETLEATRIELKTAERKAAILRIELAAQES